MAGEHPGRHQVGAVSIDQVLDGRAAGPVTRSPHCRRGDRRDLGLDRLRRPQVLLLQPVVRQVQVEAG